ncbi:MAG TPA: hypothetical protein VG388_01370 [Solirubrobacteraceae bacterium]|nr:hypothetical protein [Solirubrobacteraceae bacterium]
MSAAFAAKSASASRTLVALVALTVALVLAFAQSAFAGVLTGHAHLVSGPRVTSDLARRAVSGDPTANRQLSSATEQACGANEQSATCEISVINDINAARAAEGVQPMVLPPSYNSLTVPQQLLVLANIERTGRGLIPVSGLSGSLNAIASVAALADVDPDPSVFHGSALSANWAGGTTSPLIADFMWMYDDGIGSGNIDCTYNNQSGCWGHRDDTLYPFTAPLVMGAAYAPVTVDGPSLAELFVGGDTATGVGQADALLSPTWAQISQALQFALSATQLSLPHGAGSGQLQVSAPGMSMNLSAQITRGSGNWQVSPSSCQLAAGASCQLTITGQPGTSGTLTLYGPGGSQTVSLSSQGAATLRMRAKAGRSAVTLTGHLAGVNGSGVAGQLVTLVRRTPGAVATSVVSRARTGSAGNVTFHVSPHANTEYILTFGGSPTLTAATSGAALAHAVRSYRRHAARGH